MIDDNGKLIFEEDINEALPYGVGQLGKPSWAFDKGPKESAEIANNIQKKVIESNAAIIISAAAYFVIGFFIIMLHIVGCLTAFWLLFCFSMVLRISFLIRLSID